MKKIRKIFISLAMIIAIAGFVNPMSVDGARTYRITFRAGAHGTFANGDNKVVIDVAANDPFPDIPDINVEDGYYLLGWNETLLNAGQPVTESKTYVARYQVLTNGREYSINYVNQDNIQIATSKVMIAPLGATVVERAKTIEGHELIGLAELSIVVGESNNSITYVYRDLNVSEEYVETVVTVPVTLPPNTAVSTAGTATGGTTPPAGITDGTENIGDDQTPLSPGDGEVEDVPDEQTPLSKGEDGNNFTYLLATTGIVLALILLGVVIVKRKIAST